MPCLKIRFSLTLLRDRKFVFRSFPWPVFVAIIAMPFCLQGQRAPGSYWQQRADYAIDLHLDVLTHTMTGSQEIVYANQSPDVLDKVFFHLYFNAFQPGSEMDVRSRTIADPDPRVRDRIFQLSPQEAGYMRVLSMTQNGETVRLATQGSILEVTLAKPIRPGQTARFAMAFEAQVPLQIRRNGRDNREGVRYSMAQAYPKLCMYDRMGWHAHPYVGREFYGNWGSFDVRITLDKAYVVAASGVLRNPSAVGHGYAPEPKAKPDELTWHFTARNVHDFMWAADPGYTHRIHRCQNGVLLHTFYKSDEQFDENWERLPVIMEEAMAYANAHYGQYPYPQYSFIQGGDGGMEYPMGTLITGRRSLTSLVGVSIHEMMHSWYQGVLGFNESLFSWMDEGFTQYTSEFISEHLKAKGLLPGEPDPDPIAPFYAGYENLVSEGVEEPLSTHADHFRLNAAYSTAAYVKGAIFLHQLNYVIGREAFDKGMRAFYDRWKFRHPDDVDFIRVMEQGSGLELDWYREYMVNSTKTIDYRIDSVIGDHQQTIIHLHRAGDFPMPVDVAVELVDGRVLGYTIPLDIMRGAKAEAAPDGQPMQVESDWMWVSTDYRLVLDRPLADVKKVIVDPSGRLADIMPSSNLWPEPVRE